MTVRDLFKAPKKTAKQMAKAIWDIYAKRPLEKDAIHNMSKAKREKLAETIHTLVTKEVAMISGQQDRAMAWWLVERSIRAGKFLV